MLEYYYTLLMLVVGAGMYVYSRSIPVVFISTFIVSWFLPASILYQWTFIISWDY